MKYGDICDKCAHKEYCDMATFGGHNPRITACSQFSQLKQTNADRIRAMTDEELADFMIRAAERGGKPTDSGLVRWLDWLRQEARE